MMNLSNEFSRYVTFIGIVMCNLFLAGARVEVICGLCPTQELAMALGGVINTLFFLFAGFVIHPGAIRIYWKFMYYWSEIHWGLAALVRNEFQTVGEISGIPQQFKNGHDVIVELNADEFDETITYIYILIGIWCA